jgi:hypothetical protein
MSAVFDAKSLAAGALVWLAVIPVVKWAGRVTVNSTTPQKLGLFALHVAVAAATPPLLTYALSCETSAERLRGVTLALGAAQILDGVAHIVKPNVYSDNAPVAIASAGNVFFAAGLLGVFSVYY